MPNAAPPQAANHLLMSVGERVSDGGGRGRACGGRDPRVFVCTVGLLRLRLVPLSRFGLIITSLVDPLVLHLVSHIGSVTQCREDISAYLADFLVLSLRK